MPDLTQPVTSCPQCGSPVIARKDGKILDAEPHRLGINRPGGGTLTPVQIARAFHGAGPLLGHAAHRCRPEEQQALFDLFESNAPARGRRGGL